MAKIQRFEELQSWQKGRELANIVYDLTELPRFARVFKLRDQVQAAAGSAICVGAAPLCDINYATIQLFNYQTMELSNQ